MSKLRSGLLLLLLISIAVTATSVTVLAVGEKPFNVFLILWNAAFGSAENFSYTLFYATPMLLTGTAVSLALRAGLFNIGAEGQLYMGAVFAATWGAFTRNWFPAEGYSKIFAFATLGAGALFAFTGGALWGGLAGYLRTRRQIHEVIATIMLNFIAMAFANWVILNPLKNQETQNLETLTISPALQVSR